MKINIDKLQINVSLEILCRGKYEPNSHHVKSIKQAIAIAQPLEAWYKTGLINSVGSCASALCIIGATRPQVFGNSSADKRRQTVAVS